MSSGASDFPNGLARGPAASIPRAAASRTPASESASATLIAAEIDQEKQRTLADGLVGLAEGVSRRLVERGEDFDPDELGRLVANLAWAGLRALGPAS